MSSAPPLPPSFGAPTLEQLAGLVFELASQLHVERVHRIALETALETAGLIAPSEIDRAAAGATGRARSAAALDRSLAGLTRTMTENPDRRSPLRPKEPQAG